MLRRSQNRVKKPRKVDLFAPHMTSCRVTVHQLAVGTRAGELVGWLPKGRRLFQAPPVARFPISQHVVLWLGPVLKETCLSGSVPVTSMGLKITNSVMECFSHMKLKT